MIDAGKNIAQAIIIFADKLVQNISELGSTIIESLKLIAEGRSIKSVLENLWKAIINIVGEVINTVGDIIGDFIALVLSAILGLSGKLLRKLTSEEKKHAELIFGNSIDLDKVRLTTAHNLISVLFGILPADAISMNYMIYMNKKNPQGKSSTERMGLLIHELTHTWQGDSLGGEYVIKSIGEQGLDFIRSRGEALNRYISRMGGHHGKGGGSIPLYTLTAKDIMSQSYFVNLPVEKQAVLVEIYWAYKRME